MRTCLTSLSVALLLAACASPRYSYAPVTTTSAEVIDGRAIARSPMPPDAPRGEIALASLGLARVTPPTELRLPEFRAIVVRITITNQSTTTWGLDEAEQRIEIDERGELVTNRASTPTGERARSIQIDPGKSATLDLLFPVGARDATNIARFSVLWTVHAGARVSSGRVPFARKIEESLAPSIYAPAPQPPGPYEIPERYPTVPVP